VLLALDTATRNSGIALFDGQLLAELNWTSQDGQTAELLPRLAQLLAWHGLAPGDIEVVAVSIGPGSFTGLRVALSAAKGLALVNHLSLVGVPTLDAVALPFLGYAAPVCALVQAGRGRVYWAQYASEEGSLCSVETALLAWRGWRSAYRRDDVGGLARAVAGQTLFGGELTPATRQAIHSELGDKALFAPTAQRQAATVAELGWQRWRAGERDDIASLAPIYLHQP
jgi:tRNA threonylcarbamoyladenosine biosynthesis protein TsaB